jgi:hypothetical protein
MSTLKAVVEHYALVATFAREKCEFVAELGLAETTGGAASVVGTRGIFSSRSSHFFVGDTCE